MVDNHIDFSMIKGIEIKEILTGLNNQSDLLKNLLIKFKDNYRDYTEKIKSSLSAGDYPEAKRTVHAFKGVAGNLRAAELYSMVMDLDSKLKDVSENSEEIQTLISNIDRELNGIIESIEDFEKAQLRENSKESEPSESIENLKEDLINLQSLLTDYEVESGKVYESIYNKLQNNEFKNDADSILSHIKKYDFDSAVIIVNRIIEKISL